MYLARAPLVLVCFFLAACSTTVNMRQTLDTSTSARLKFGDIDVTSSLTTVSPDVSAQLKRAVSERLTKVREGTIPTKVQIVITEFAVASGAERFLIGAFAGSNRMAVSVSLINDQGKQIAGFDVVRSANPGGYGIFYDQQSATIDAVADGVSDALAAKN